MGIKDREELRAHTWLLEAKDMLEEHIFGEEINCHVSYGFPHGRKKAVGQAWQQNGIQAIFISPVIYRESNKLELLGILVHELIHLLVGLDQGHKGAFRRKALEIGLEGQMTSTTISAGLKARLESLPLPNPPEMALESVPVKKQGTRLIKIMCPCDRILRVSRKEIDSGTILCGTCEGEYIER